MNSESKQKNIAIINPEDFGYDLAVLARKMGYTVTGVMIELPDRRVGVMMVFRTFKHVAYALILSADEPVEVADRFTQP